MSDFEIHPVGTAWRIAQIEREPLTRQVASLNCALTMNMETIREISERRHAPPSDAELKNAERALREFWGLSQETARRYAETALEAGRSA